MIHIELSDVGPKRLVYYLAMEEYLAKETSIDDAFFLWRVPPTVIFGRNQVMDAEVNLEYCKSHGVNVFRRKSGGGCVYSDLGNIMISYVTSSDNVSQAFALYLERLCQALRSLGVDAAPSGRNDVMIAARKVSGNAFRQLPGAGDAAAEGAGNHFPAGFLALQPGIHPGDEVAGAVLNVADVQRRHVGVDGLLGAGILVGRHVIPEPAETKQRQSQKEQGIYRHDNQQFDAVFHFSAGSHAVSPSLRTTKEVGMGRMPMTG